MRDASIATDLNARILKLPFREGESFKAGDTLFAFDCDRTEAGFRAAEAEDAVNRITLDNAQQLDRHHAIGRIEVQASKAKWDKAHASADALRFRVPTSLIAYSGLDGFTVEVSDGNGEITLVTIDVTITLNPVQVPPSALIPFPVPL